ncbi:winged helix-turn-helix domain-containing protein [Bradyrhizobium liaoningense]|uniref:ATP-binding protein n=1 Tax=Bradyrhizobium liaoningense TaxID=43992 RepID=UPI001BAB7FD8|nr:winged helix-turn-helix domain-containing protein [Bradyrhizobium liaoningense]MBR0907840.1 winged helix-turn-helix domain-containing protein [Bradyrhizobium liaoningense]
MQNKLNDGEAFLFGPFRLSVSERLLLKEGKPLHLGSRAFDILIALVDRAGEVISHRELFKRVWSDVVVDEASLRVQIAGLRKALGDGRAGARYIANIPAKGYCFVAPVERSRQISSSASAGQPSFRSDTLPDRLNRMVGRDEAIEYLSSEIRQRRFVSIVGSGGVGKTTVAVAVAHALADEFQGNVCFVDLSAVREAAFLVTAVASVIGCLAQTQDSRERLLGILSDKRMLLILDSCEHVLDAAALLAEDIHREAPSIYLMTTSREALRAEGENVYPLRPLEHPTGPVTLTTAEALAFPAVQLFMERASTGEARQTISEEEANLVVDICRQLDGLPLAIELAASRVGAYGIRGLARVIGDHLMLVWRARRGVPRHQTLQAMLDWSYELLSHDERATLAALSVFNGTFTLNLAQVIISRPERDELQIANDIVSLIDKSLIAVSPAEGESCYRLLDTTRSYAALKTKELGETNRVARRHALYFAERLARFWTPAVGRDLAAYARYVGDIRAALEWSFSEDGDSSVGVALSAGAMPLFLSMSMLSECRRWCLQAIHALSEENRGTKLELKLQLALAISSNHAHSDSSEVGAVLERALNIADALQDAEYQLEVLAGLNLHLARMAEFSGSLIAAERYAEIAARAGGVRAAVTAEWMLGASHHLVGNQLAAQKCYEKGFGTASASGIAEVHSFGFDHQIRALIGYARTMWLRGFPDQAARLAYQGIEVAGSHEHPVSLCICLQHATPVFLWRGDLQIASNLIERLIACASKYSLPNYEAGGKGLRGELMLAIGDTQLGIRMLRDALSILRSERRFMLSSSVYRALAEGLAAAGEFNEAFNMIGGLLADARSGSESFELPELLRTRARVLLSKSADNWSAAEASLCESLKYAQEQAAVGWELRSAVMLSSLWRDRGLLPEARGVLAGSIEKFSEGFDTVDLVQAVDQLQCLEAPVPKQ